MKDDIEAGFERIGRYKHGDEVAVVDRTPANRETDQQAFEAFARGEDQ